MFNEIQMDDRTRSKNQRNFFGLHPADKEGSLKDFKLGRNEIRFSV